MNKRLFGLQDVSRARNYIYGAAIVWIVFFHSGFSLKTKLFETIKSYGDCGVEIFFLLSGICLFYSYSKDENTLAFYKRRLAKILPPYLIVYGIVFVILDVVDSFNLGQFILDYTLLDFWLHGLGRAPWFVAAIIVFYAFYPLIYRIFFKAEKYNILKVSIFFASVCLLIVILVIFCPHLNIFAARIPVFIVGCLLGRTVYNDFDVKFRHLLVLALFLIGTYALFGFVNIWWLRNVFFLTLSMSLILILSQIYKFSNRFIPLLNKPFLFLGNLTLEIYLCHEKIKESFVYFLRYCNISVDFSDAWYQWICILLAVITAFAVKQSVRLFRFCIVDKKIDGKSIDTH